MTPAEQLGQILATLRSPRSGRLHFEYADSFEYPNQRVIEGSATYDVVFDHDSRRYALSAAHAHYGDRTDEIRAFAGAGYAFLREVREVETQADSPIRSDLSEFNAASLEARWHAIALPELFGPFASELATLGSPRSLERIATAAQEVGQTGEGRWRIRVGPTPDLWRSSAASGPGLLPAPCWLTAPEFSSSTADGGERAGGELILTISEGVLTDFELEDHGRYVTRRLSMHLSGIDRAVSINAPSSSEIGEPLIVRPMAVAALLPVHYIDDLTIRLPNGTLRVISALRHEDDPDEPPWQVGQRIAVMTRREADPEGFADEDENGQVSDPDSLTAVDVDSSDPRAVMTTIEALSARSVGEKATLRDPTGARDEISLLVQLPAQSRLALGEWVLAHERHTPVVNPPQPMFIQRLSDGKIIIGRAPWREPIPQNDPGDFAPDDWV